MNILNYFWKIKSERKLQARNSFFKYLKGVQNVLFPNRFSNLNRARKEGYLTGTPASLFPERYRCDNRFTVSLNTGISPERMDNNGRFHLFVERNVSLWNA